MISNIIATIILDPLEQGAGMLGAYVIIWFFSPILGFMFSAAMVPIFLLAVWWTPRIPAPGLAVPADQQQCHIAYSG